MLSSWCTTPNAIVLVRGPKRYRLGARPFRPKHIQVTQKGTFFVLE